MKCKICETKVQVVDDWDTPFEMNKERHTFERCLTIQLFNMTEERDAWKAKTRDAIREYMTNDPDLRARELSDLNGVLEAELDLAKTRLEIAKEQLEKGLSMKSVLLEIVDERIKQDHEWGGPEHDDEHDAFDWCNFIRKQLARISTEESIEKGAHTFRARMVKVAALAVAGIQARDRIEQKERPS
jgi:hypothetical protein